MKADVTKSLTRHLISYLLHSRPPRRELPLGDGWLSHSYLGGKWYKCGGGGGGGGDNGGGGGGQRTAMFTQQR